MESRRDQGTDDRIYVFEYDSIISARTVRTVLVTMHSKARGRQCYFFFFSNRSSFPGRFALLSKYDLHVVYRGSMKFYSFLFRSNTFQMYRKIFNCVIDESNRVGFISHWTLAGIFFFFNSLFFSCIIVNYIIKLNKNEFSLN